MTIEVEVVSPTEGSLKDLRTTPMGRTLFGGSKRGWCAKQRERMRRLLPPPIESDELLPPPGTALRTGCGRPRHRSCCFTRVARSGLKSRYTQGLTQLFRLAKRVRMVKVGPGNDTNLFICVEFDWKNILNIQKIKQVPMKILTCRKK
jgi:hypothetical protein